MKDKSLYILHALDCIERIEKYTIEGVSAFLEDDKTQDAVIRNIEIIGQCIKDYGVQNLVGIYPDVPWKQISNMRNILAHEYLGVDLNLIWEVVEKHLIPLKNILNQLK